MIKKLGGRCVWPGGCTEERPKFLEFDHIEPDFFPFSRLSRWSRIARYEREAAEGKIQLLCGFHNKLKGTQSMSEVIESLKIKGYECESMVLDEVPF